MQRDQEGHTFVHWAALGGANNVLEFLLDRGCPMNEKSRNDYGPQPIHWACVYGHAVTLDLFLERGVPIDSLDANGCSPLIISAQYGQSLCISYLLQKGANKFHVDINGSSALHWAAFKGKHICNSIVLVPITDTICLLFVGYGIQLHPRFHQSMNINNFTLSWRRNDVVAPSQLSCQFTACRIFI